MKNFKYTPQIVYSKGQKREFTPEKAGFQVLKDPMDKTKPIVLAIELRTIVKCFKEQIEKLRQTIR